ASKRKARPDAPAPGSRTKRQPSGPVQKPRFPLPPSPGSGKGAASPGMTVSLDLHPAFAYHVFPHGGFALDERRGFLRRQRHGGISSFLEGGLDLGLAQRLPRGGLQRLDDGLRRAARNE